MNRSPLARILLVPLALGLITFSHVASAAEVFVPVYFGTYTSGESKGIYTSKFSPSTGKLSEPVLAAETEQPSFLAFHPNGKFLYAVNETTEYQGQQSGAISAFAIIPGSDKLKFLNKKPTQGGAPCHLCVDKTGSAVLIANYVGGSIASIRIQADGSLGETASFIQHKGSSITSRQNSPHAHSIDLDSANTRAYVSDLGTDKVYVYQFDSETGKLTPDPKHPFVKLPPGSGPRHFAMHPSLDVAYGLNEMSRTVSAFRWDRKSGSLESIQSITTVPAGHQGGSTAEIAVHSSGKFVYASNRGHDSIAIYRVNPESGQLTAAGHTRTGGKTPRNFALSPRGSFLLAANQSSNSVVVFHLDAKTGALSDSGHRIAVPNPVCIAFPGSQPK